MPSVKVTVQGLDRQTLINLVKAERRNIEPTSVQKLTGAQNRAIKFYEEHLHKVQNKLNPNSSYDGKY